MTKEVYSVPTNQIAICPEMQVRNEVDGERVARYASDIEATLLRGDALEFPPIELYKVSDPVLGEELWLVEGFHRFYAYQEAGLKEHDCVITEGTKKEAIQRALTANYAHDRSGVALSKEERVRAMETLYELNAEEIGYDSSKLVELIESLGVSAVTARRDTKELRAKLKHDQMRAAVVLINKGMSIREAAQELGISKTTVQKYKESEDAVPEMINDQKGTVTEIMADDDELVPMFGDEELDVEETVNPMDDFNKRLAEREARKSSRNTEDTIVAPNDYANVTNNAIEMETEELLAELHKRLLKTSRDTVVQRLQANPEMAEQFSMTHGVMTRIVNALA